MLQTVRAFALEQLARDDDLDGVAAAHAEYQARYVVAESGLLRGTEQVAALERLNSTSPDVRAALMWAASHDPVAALDLALAMAPYWDSTSSLTEARNWLGLVLEPTSTPPLKRASASTWAAYFAALQGDLDAAAGMASTALAVWEAHGIDAGRGYALLMLGFIAVERGDTGTGDELLRASADALERGGDRWGMARPLNNLGELARMQGDLEAAERFHSRALAIVRDVDDLGSQPSVLCGLGHVHLARSDDTAARTVAREAIEICVAIGNRLGTAAALELVALSYLDSDPGRSARVLAAACTLRDELGTPVESRDRSPIDEARRLLEGSDEWDFGSTASIDEVIRPILDREW
jgi:hypothetical protein